MENIPSKLNEILSPKSVRTVLPNPKYTSKSEEELLEEAFKNPIDSEKFENEKTKKAAIIFSDYTRHYSPFTQLLVKKIREKTDDIKIISAHGTHTPCPSEFLKKVLGEELYSAHQNDVIVSSTQNPSSKYEYIGETDRKTPIEINKELLDRDFIISSLNIQPHYFAGFEGGAKILLPGCSSLKTVVTNHSYVIGNPNSKELKIHGNDVREDMNQVPALLEKLGIKHRIVDFVLNHEKSIVKIGYGNPVSAHKFLAEAYSKEIYAVKTKPSRLVVTVADGPLGKNLYQALKAAAFASNSVIEDSKKKSIVMLVASLEAGIGGDAFKYEMERYGNMEAKAIIEDLRARAKEGKITEASQKPNRLAMDDAKMNLIVVSPSAAKDVEGLLEKTKYKFFRQLNEAFESLDESHRKDAIFLPYGSATVPVP